MAAAADEVPALAYDVLNAVDGFHAQRVGARDLRDPLHARRVAPRARQRRALQCAPRHGAQAALRLARGLRGVRGAVDTRASEALLVRGWFVTGVRQVRHRSEWQRGV